MSIARETRIADSSKGAILKIFGFGFGFGLCFVFVWCL
jgi:hypothetical protein